MTLKEYIYQTLRNDNVAEIGLHTLLGKSSTPYGVYFMSPPEKPDFPIITYFINTQVGNFPREIPFMITAWGNNYEVIQDRIYTLLNDRVVEVSDYHNLFLKWDWASPEMWDDNYEIYFRQDRFLSKGVRL